MNFCFEAFALDTDAYVLTKGTEVIALEPQVFALLQFLIENRDRVVSKDEIIEHVWDGRIVSDAALSSGINGARRAVGDSGKAQAIIKTFPRRGFRFVADVTDDNPSEAAVTPISNVSDKPTIAVLPFDNLSGDPEQEYFSDGITEDIITALSRLRQFFVIARNTTFTFKGKAVDVPAVARELGVRYVLEGSVRKAGERLRISAQLIDGDSGNHIWAEQYDRDLGDIFAVQDEITMMVVGSIQPALVTTEQDRARRKSADDLGAWELFQRGMWHLRRRTLEDLIEARGFFHRSIELNPSFAPSYAGVAHSFWQQLVLGMVEEPGAVRDEVVSNARMGVELDREDPYTHVVLGRIYSYFFGKYDEGYQQLQIARELNPNDTEVKYSLGSCLIALGRPAEALPLLEEVIRQNPRDPARWLHMELLARAHFNRHSPYTIQIRGNRTTFPPPRELYPLCSHPMA